MEGEANLAASVHGGGSVNEPQINLSPTVSSRNINDNDLPTSSAIFNTAAQFEVPSEGVLGSGLHVSTGEVVVPPSSGQSSSSKQSSDSTKTGPLFSQVLKQRVKSRATYPKKDQAILFTSIDGITIKDYIVGLGSLIGPQNLRYASRISNNRVCCYLSSKDCVDKFMTEHAGISVGDIFIAARRLITPASRIVLSNLPPIIPDEIIESALKSVGLKVVSPISDIGVGIGMPQYNHVGSFRRQVYIVPDENQVLPPSLIINFEGDGYRMYLSNDELRCFLCKTVGHISKQCTNNTGKDPPKESTDAAPCATESRTANVCELEKFGPKANQNSAISVDSNITALSKDLAPMTGVKRALSSEPAISESDENTKLTSQENVSCQDSLQKSVTFKKVRKRSKKRKPDPPEAFEPLIPIFEKKKFILSFNDFKTFLAEVKGNSHPKTIARQFTKDLPLLVDMLNSLASLIEVRALKERFRRLTVSLSKDADSSMSVDSGSDFSEEP